jgi:MFS family permease
MDYLHFVRKNHRFLSFALLLIWFSSPGQTFFISLFSGHIRAEFGLSHGGFGSLYSLATLASGLLMIWVGRKIDDIDLRIYSTLVCAGVTVACFFMATVTSLILLCLAIFALRITGQGLMTHTAATSMARYFDDERGKALGVASLGRPAGEATFPLIGVLLISTIGWRWSWTVIGGGYALLLIPAVLWLLKGHGERHRRLIARNEEQGADGRLLGRQWSRREVIRDLHFYLILPAVVAPSFIMTGVLFHQVYLVESKGWTLTLFAGSYIGHAAAAVAASLLSGPLVDRVGAVRLLRYYLLPIAYCGGFIGSRRIRSRERRVSFHDRVRCYGRDDPTHNWGDLGRDLRRCPPWCDSSVGLRMYGFLYCAGTRCFGVVDRLRNLVGGHFRDVLRICCCIVRPRHDRRIPDTRNGYGEVKREFSWTQPI